MQTKPSPFRASGHSIRDVLQKSMFTEIQLADVQIAQLTNLNPLMGALKHNLFSPSYVSLLHTFRRQIIVIKETKELCLSGLAL